MSAGDAAGPNREVHFAFQAADDRRGAGVLRRRGGSSAQSRCTRRSCGREYHPGYYGAFVRDPDGNNIEAVFHGARPRG